MKLPQLNKNVGKASQTLINFKGLSKQTVLNDGELSDMKNLSSAFYPCLSPRGKREVLKQLINPTDIASFGDKLFYIDDNKFYYDGEVKGKVTNTKKSIAVMNDYVVIFPDKVAYDSITDSFALMENHFKATTSGQITFTEDAIVLNSGTFTGFKVGDGIIISGCSSIPFNNRSVVIRTIEGSRIGLDPTTLEKGEEAGLVEIKRTVPDMEYIVEHDNRLWGCDKSKTVYCSKQGSHTNFNVFEGLVTDSYFTEVGSAGDFTGAVSYNDKVYFFKEDCIHKMFGYKPTTFQVVTTSTQGVKMGCERSLAVTNNLLFYLSRDGIMCFDSTVPQLISEKLGYIRYDEAVAGGNRKFYYVCLRKGTKWELLVYDSDLNLWHKQDNLHALCFNYFNGHLIYLDADSKAIVKIDSEDSTERVEWSCTTGEMNTFYQDKKGVVKLKFRVELEVLSRLSVYISHNNEEFVHVKTFYSTTKKTVYLPIQPKRCDYFKIKFEGQGDFKIFSIVREFNEGSEV